LNYSKHISFLKTVFFYTLTAFGGPQAHIGMLQRTFVEKGKFLTHEELLDYYSFCQLLPGASSTQLIGCIGYKRGGILLSILSLLIWILPASVIMCTIGLFLSDSANNTIQTSQLLEFIKPMTLGFLIFSIWQTQKSALKNPITYIIFFISLIVCILFFKIPWVFPLMIILAGFITNISKKRIPSPTFINKQRKVRFFPIVVFLLIFMIAGYLSEKARQEEWKNRKAYNLFENFYRFGSIVFGGGDVLFPMMLDQYVARPTDEKTILKNPNLIKINKEDLLVGFGIVRAIPGPVFSVGSYTGTMALKGENKAYQIIGSIIGSFSLFLPGILLMLFFFPLFQQYREYVFVHRAMEGIHAVIVALMLGAAFYLISDYTFINNIQLTKEIIVVLVTFSLLNFTKTPSFLIVILFLIFGFLQW
jgi:chromate transporter